jgi:hypothetical protein
MKKAKLMLSALGVCALLATAFAFKAQSFSKHVLYFNDPQVGGTGCTDAEAGFTITTGAGTSIRASIASVASNCPTVTVTTIDDLQ